MRVRRKIVIGVFAAVVIIACAAVALPRLEFYTLTRRWFPIDKVDVLNSPSTVVGWSEDGLCLADGRILQLPGVRKLPKESAALTEATKRGVEIAADGRVYGLVRVHHWCGNDPVREHIARVNLSDLMIFLRIGEPVAPVPEAEFLIREAGGTFAEWGWRISEFHGFQSWQFIKDSGR